MQHASRPFLLIVLGLLAPSAAAADVWRVPSQVANIQIAINVAAPGDVVLVAPGTYTQVVEADGKGVSLVADGSATLATLEIRNLPGDQAFVVDGFTFDLPDVFAGLDIAFLAQDNAGSLRVQDCTFLGDPGISGNWMAGVSAYPGAPGARVENSADVSFHGCMFVGGDGADLWDEDLEASASSGGSGLEAFGSSVAVFECLLDGGTGGSQNDTVSYSGGVGGSGVVTANGHVVVAGCTLLGGNGGSADCDFFACGYGGDGGDGVKQTSGALVTQVRGNAFTPGSGGSDGDFGGSGEDGELVDSWDVVERFAGAYRPFDAASPVREGAAAVLAFDGVPGDGLLLFGGLGAGFLPKSLNQGVFLLDTPLLLPGVFVGLVPAGGALGVPLTVPELGPGVDAVDLHLQPVTLAGSQALLGPARVLTLLDGGL